MELFFGIVAFIALAILSKYLLQLLVATAAFLLMPIHTAFNLLAGKTPCTLHAVLIILSGGLVYLFLGLVAFIAANRF